MPDFVVSLGGGVLPDVELLEDGVDELLEPLLDELGGVELELLLDGEELGEVLLEELLLGLVLDSVELVLELGGVAVGLVLGVVIEELLGVVEELLVPVLLRSQPVAAAVARARTATTGIRFFMTSPVSRAFEGWFNPHRGVRERHDAGSGPGQPLRPAPDISRTRPCFSQRTVQNTCQFPCGANWDARRARSRRLFRSGVRVAGLR